MAEARSHADFADRLRRDQGRLFGFIHALVRNLDDADDLFQQTAVVLWNKFADFDPERSFFAWACGVARFEVANFLRSRGRQKLYFTDELNLLLAEAHESLAHDQTEDRRAALGGCLDKLRAGDRELLVRCYGDDAKITEVAREHGRSSQSIHNSLKRIRKALYHCVERAVARATRPNTTE